MVDPTGPAVLVIDLVGQDRLDHSAVGCFCSGHRDAVQERLERFLACSFSSLQIDFAGVTLLSAEVGAVFASAARHLEPAGGRQEVVNARPGVRFQLGVLPHRSTWGEAII